MNLIQCKDSECSDKGRKVQHHGNGLCFDCWHRAYAKVRTYPMGFCVNVNHEGFEQTQIIARGLCRRCYNALRMAGKLGQFPRRGAIRRVPPTQILPLK